MSQDYYTLVASLPHLIRFDSATTSPINPERLREYMTMMDREHFKIVARGAELIAWQRQPIRRTDAELFAQYIAIHAMIGEYPFWGILEVTLNMRTVMAALRRKHLGLPAPKKGEPWGLGRWVRHIEINWDSPNLGLEYVYPWIPKARELMDKGDALELERFLMAIKWDELDRICGQCYFGFERVLTYLFKWDILQRWISCNVEEAKTRLDEMVAEAIHEEES